MPRVFLSLVTRVMWPLSYDFPCIFSLALYFRVFFSARSLSRSCGGGLVYGALRVRSSTRERNQRVELQVGRRRPNSWIRHEIKNDGNP